MRAVSQAQAMINFVTWAVNTLEITNGEQWALHKFSTGCNLSSIKTLFCAKLSGRLLQNRKGGTKLGNMLRSYYCGLTIPSSLESIMPCSICHLMQNDINVSQFALKKAFFPASVFVSQMQTMLTLYSRKFNENPSMRAVAKILWPQTSGHFSNFCKQFEQRLNFESTFKLNGTIPYPSQSNL